MLEWAGVEAPERQYRAFPPRRWLFDFAWPAHRLLLEVDGGQWVQGRHNRGLGIEGDAEKQSRAAAEGWRTMRVTRKMIETGRAVMLVEVALGIRPASDVDPPRREPKGPAVPIQPRKGQAHANH
jgi:very-short-patch-repair endonuclease